MKNLLLFLKGFLMGICDLIPGISGGTIAFITGIYEKLIESIKNLFNLIFYPFSFLIRKSKFIKKEKVDWKFLFILFFGIFSAIFLGSKIIKFLLDNYYIYTISFFIGLILASSKIIFNNIKNHKIKNILFGFIGLIIGISLSFLIPLNINPSYSYVFLGGFLAISALFLPGISGAFILLILGLYEFMINVLNNILDKIDYFIFFLLGAILGAFFISRLISFLFKKDKCKTLYFLLGIVIGALSVPVKTIINFKTNLFLIFLFVFIGGLLVYLFNRYNK